MTPANHTCPLTATSGAEETAAAPKLTGDAVRFYESLGFTASHEGLKLLL